jgi:uncharacterized cupin superfamily protein
VERVTGSPSVPEARLRETPAGLVPEGDGWFVVNARDAAWEGIEGSGRWCVFEGDARFADYGVNIHVVDPGEPNARYHGEDAQEDFLVLSGECLLVIEGEEHRLRQWDLVHCPPWTNHVLIGAGAGPCAILMIGARKRDERVIYPVEPAALRHGAGVSEETSEPKVAYAGLPAPVALSYREGDLPAEVDRAG